MSALVISAAAAAAASCIYQMIRKWLEKRNMYTFRGLDILPSVLQVLGTILRTHKPTFKNHPSSIVFVSAAGIIFS